MFVGGVRNRADGEFAIHEAADAECEKSGATGRLTGRSLGRHCRSRWMTKSSATGSSQWVQGPSRLGGRPGGVLGGRMPTREGT